MRITVKFTGLFRILAVIEEDVLDLDEGATINQLSRILKQKYEKLPLEDNKTFFQINGQIVAPDRILSEGEQVHIFQLLAGG